MVSGEVVLKVKQDNVDLNEPIQLSFVHARRKTFMGINLIFGDKPS